MHDGSAWTPLGRLTTAVPLNTWVPIEVAASTEAATMTVNGQPFETDKRAAGADTLTEVTFTTSDPAAYGMTFFVDDVDATAGSAPAVACSQAISSPVLARSRSRPASRSGCRSAPGRRASRW